MSMRLMTKLAIAAASVSMGFAAVAAKPAQAATLAEGTWQPFLFEDAQQPASDLQSGDTFWQFTAPTEGAILKVTDTFLTGDVFSIFDFGQLIGTTSFVPTSANYLPNPDEAYAALDFSHGSFTLASGLHNISITPTVSPYAAQGGGAAYLRWDADTTTNTKQVPEPFTVGGTLLAGAMGLLMKKKQARQQAKARVKA